MTGGALELLTTDQGVVQRDPATPGRALLSGRQLLKAHLYHGTLPQCVLYKVHILYKVCKVYRVYILFKLNMFYKVYKVYILFKVYMLYKL